MPNVATERAAFFIAAMLGVTGALLAREVPDEMPPR